MRYAGAEAVKPLLTGGGEIAFLDVREHGQYGEGHPFFAVNLPYSRLEALAPVHGQVQWRLTGAGSPRRPAPPDCPPGR